MTWAFDTEHVVCNQSIAIVSSGLASEYSVEFHLRDEDHIHHSKYLNQLKSWKK